MSDYLIYCLNCHYCAEFEAKNKNKVNIYKLSFDFQYQELVIFNILHYYRWKSDYSFYCRYAKKIKFNKKENVKRNMLEKNFGDQ